MKFSQAVAAVAWTFLAVTTAHAHQAKDDDDAKLLREVKDAHPLWLRERCSEQPNTLDASTSSNQLGVVKVQTAPGGFVTQFSDQHECFFTKEFMVQELFGSDKSAPPPHKPTTPDLFLWNANLLVAPSLYDSKDISDRSDNTRKFLSNLLSTGVAQVENVSNNCAEFGSLFTAVSETEAGKVLGIDDKNDDDDAHFFSTVPRTHMVSSKHGWQGPPPDIVALHCAHDESCNNYTQLAVVDGFAVAQALCQQDRALFDVLCKTPLWWEQSNRYAPILQVEEKDDKEASLTGETSDCSVVVKAVNFPFRGGWAPKVDKDELDVFYKAKQTFSDMVQSDQFKVELKLSPGELFLLDNRRVLQSLTHPLTSVECLQACYLDRDGLVRLYDLLKRKYASMTETPFRSLKGAVKADFDRMGVEYDEAVVKKTKDKLIAILEGLKDSYLGQPVSLYEHNVQTASRALRAGEDDETIVVSLFHDIFETLGVKNHGELIAAMLSPWISPRNHWMLAHHEVFQGYYYFEDYGVDKNKRDMYKDHPVYNQTVVWCEFYDQKSFDPDYPSLPLSTFVPAIDRVLARPQYWWNPAHPKAGAVSSASAFQNFQLGKSVSECPDTWQCYEL